MLLIIMKRKGTGAQTIPNNELFENQFSVILERVLDFNLIYLLKSIDLHSILLKWLSPGRGCLSSSPDGQNRMDQKEHEKKSRRLQLFSGSFQGQWLECLGTHSVLWSGSQGQEQDPRRDVWVILGRGSSHIDGVHNEHGLKPLGLEFDFLISRPRNAWTLLISPLTWYRLVRIKSRRGIPEAPAACMTALSYGSNVRNAPPASHFRYTLWALQNSTTRKKGEGMRV